MMTQGNKIAGSQSSYHERAGTVVEGESCVSPLGHNPQRKLLELQWPVALIAIYDLRRLEHESRTDKEEHIAWKESMPNAANKLSDNQGEKAGTLPLWSQPLVHICNKQCHRIQQQSGELTPYCIDGMHCDYVAYSIAYHQQTAHAEIEEECPTDTKGDRLCPFIDNYTNTCALMHLHCRRNRPVQTFQCSGSLARLV